MSSMEARHASQMHNVRFSSIAASHLGRRLPGQHKSRKSKSKQFPAFPIKTSSAVLSLKETDKPAKATKQPTLPNDTDITVASKKFWKVPSRKFLQDPQKTWARMMKDIQEVGSAVTVLGGYRKAGKLSKASLVGTLLRMKQLKEWTHVVEVIGWLKHQRWWTVSELDFNLLLVAYAKIGEPEKVKKAIRSMQKAGFQPNVMSYTCLIEAYGTKGQLYEAEGVFDQMLEEGPNPTVLTYQTMIGALVKHEKYEDADRIYKNMETDNLVKPDQRMCNLMIHSYGKRGMIEEAFHLSRKMKALNIPLSLVTFNTLIHCQSTVESTESVFKQMQRNNIVPDAVTYAARIGAFAKARRAEEAQYFFKVMVSSGIRPNRTHYNILLDAYANCKMPAQAEALLREMKRNKCTPDVHSYSTLMHAYVNTSDLERAEGIFERMKSAGIEPNIVTYGTMIKGYGDQGNLNAMVKKYEEMIGKQVKINDTICTTMLQAFGKYDSLDRAKDWYRDVVASGLVPDTRAQNTLLGLSEPLFRREEILDFLENLP